MCSFSISKFHYGTLVLIDSVLCYLGELFPPRLSVNMSYSYQPFPVCLTLISHFLRKMLFCFSDTSLLMYSDYFQSVPASITWIGCLFCYNLCNCHAIAKLVEDHRSESQLRLTTILTTTTSPPLPLQFPALTISIPPLFSFLKCPKHIDLSPFQAARKIWRKDVCMFTNEVKKKAKKERSLCLPKMSSRLVVHRLSSSVLPALQVVALLACYCHQYH